MSHSSQLQLLALAATLQTVRRWAARHSKYSLNPREVNFCVYSNTWAFFRPSEWVYEHKQNPSRQLDLVHVPQYFNSNSHGLQINEREESIMKHLLDTCYNRVHFLGLEVQPLPIFLGYETFTSILT